MRTRTEARYALRENPRRRRMQLQIGAIFCEAAGRRCLRSGFRGLQAVEL